MKNEYNIKEMEQITGYNTKTIDEENLHTYLQKVFSIHFLM
jgi:hypothetical protein